MGEGPVRPVRRPTGPGRPRPPRPPSPPAALPEREPHPGAFLAFEALSSALEHSDIWPAVFVRFEAGLLEELGFGLDLSRCAATGSTDDLVYVSPRTGRAVSRAAGEPYKDRLLPLPPFLLSSQARPAATATSAPAWTSPAISWSSSSSAR